MVAGLVAAAVILSACSNQNNAASPAAESGPPVSSLTPTSLRTTAAPVSTTPPHTASAQTSTPEPSPSPTDPPSSGQPETSESPATSSPAAGFTSTISPIDDALAARMGTSWRPGCPVELADLRYLSVSYRGLDDADHQGELVVAASVAPDVVEIFRSLYTDRYPIASLRLVDDFGGSDDGSMAADNSSAFNCRPVTGGGGFSEHSYGTAIDLNPVQNPYLNGSTVLPDAGRSFADRHPAPGVIEPGDDVVAAFAAYGWKWGGEWSGPIDYQHFSVSGR